MLCVSLFVMWRHRSIVNATRSAGSGGSGGAGARGLGDEKEDAKLGATIVSKGRSATAAKIGTGAGDRKTISSAGDRKSAGAASNKALDKLFPLKELVYKLVCIVRVLCNLLNFKRSVCTTTRTVEKNALEK